MPPRSGDELLAAALVNVSRRTSDLVRALQTLTRLLEHLPRDPARGPLQRARDGGGATGRAPITIDESPMLEAPPDR